MWVVSDLCRGSILWKSGNIVGDGFVEVKVKSVVTGPSIGAGMIQDVLTGAEIKGPLTPMMGNGLQPFS